jgi:hypothetical protein
MVRGLLGLDVDSDPPDDYPECLPIDDISRILIELLEEGPDGRSGDNIGMWVGHPVVLPPPSPILNVLPGTGDGDESLAGMDLLRDTGDGADAVAGPAPDGRQ